MTQQPHPDDSNAHSSDGERDQKLLTITEAASIVRAPVATLRYWRHLGTGPRSFRLGRRVLYRVLFHGLGSLIETLVASSCWDWICRSWTCYCLPSCPRSRRALVFVLHICVAFLPGLSPLVLVFLLVLVASLHPHPQMRILGLEGSARSSHLLEAYGFWCLDLSEKEGWVEV